MMNCWGCLLIIAVTGLEFVVSSTETNTTECKELYHPNGPRIVPCKKEITLQKGQNFTLICRSNTNIKFNQQEVPEEIIGDFAIKTRKLIHENDIDKYEIALDLINVDRYAIGYYACKDSSITDDVLNYLTMEPNNTELVSYTYIYVNGTDSLFAPMREVVMSRSGYYIVECRPSTPEVEVKIMLSDIAVNTYARYSPKLGFVFDSDSIEVLVDPVPTTLFTCHCEKQHNTEEKYLIFVKQQKSHPKPTVYGKHHNFLPGETFSLNCSVVYEPNAPHNLTWMYPNDYVRNTVEFEHNNSKVTAGSILYSYITVRNATKLHAGNYTCVSQIHCANKQATFVKIYLDQPRLTMKKIGKEGIIETPQNTFKMSVEVKSYPPANLTFYKNDIEITTRKNGTYEIKPSTYNDDVFMLVRKHSVEDSANYTIVAKNGNKKETATYDLRFYTAPTVNFGYSDKICAHNTIISLVCEVTGYYLPNITWILTNNNSKQTRNRPSDKVEVLSVYKEKAILNLYCDFAGSITCSATNTISKTLKSANQTINLIVHEVSNGFGINVQPIIEGGRKYAWFPEGEQVSITCLASKHDFASVGWITANKSDVEETEESSPTTFSHKAKLKISNISLDDNGTYVCRGVTHNGTVKEDIIDITVAALQPPATTFYSDTNGTVQFFQPVYINCIAHGIPLPKVTWLKDNAELNINGSSRYVISNALNRTAVNTSIIIGQLKEEHIGKYECVADSRAGQVKNEITLVLKVNDTEPAFTKYYIVIGVIIFVAIILVIYLICKIKKEKQFRKQLAAAGLLYFEKGVTKSINPDLGIDEQAELLPYDKKFEFSLDKLDIGKQLGAGAFGVVYKAEARGIINAEETTPVAVKMVKKTADNMYIKALASELKIMVHLGKHINIVNLLGACTKNIGKRELMVIVEYCKFGNIHNYMQRHRDVFIDQFSDNNKDMSFGKVNRGYDTSGSTGLQSDYGTANTQDTDHTFLTNNTNRTCRKNVPSQPTEVVKVSEGYVQPEWRSNYESDYSYEGRTPRPLTSRDLLAWAFQIARGMEYLASRKVLHGDLAARNILLADDNIVKICDFGLARSIYKNDEYKKKENSPLPVKWLAIECISDSIFSTQSDVWSFGVVLWELFSLAKTPYPNIDPRNILQFLTEGHRLDKPAYADDRIYSLMKRCWEQKPTMRPSFTQLQEILGTFLEDNVRNHYVDLNSEFMDQNSKPEGQEDSLAMMCAPDYNNLVTPSPHHYVNGIGSFFPNPPKLDEDGYLQISPNSSHDIFSPKSTDTKFDFDPRKFNSRPSVASSCGSELTPMLTLNNLPRSGSDSDHEGNTSPYLKVCPRIEEETDEVFEIKQNNAKNAQNTAVSNPTYITFDIDVEKKTPMNINSYVNIVPNGLVK